MEPCSTVNETVPSPWASWKLLILGFSWHIFQGWGRQWEQKGKKVSDNVFDINLRYSLSSPNQSRLPLWIKVRTVHKTKIITKRNISHPLTNQNKAMKVVYPKQGRENLKEIVSSISKHPDRTQINKGLKTILHYKQNVFFTHQLSVLDPKFPRMWSRIALLTTYGWSKVGVIQDIMTWDWILECM